MNYEQPLPSVDSPEVVQACEYILSLTRKENRLNNFLRNYLKGSLNRIAFNVVLLRRLPMDGVSYLDIGSFGIEPLILKKEFPSLSMAGVSYEGDLIGMGPEGLYDAQDASDPSALRVERVHLENEKLPYPDDTFDLITCFEVLEHLKFDPVAMLKEIKRVLKQDGCLVLTTPNIHSVQAISRILAGDSPQESPLFHRSREYGVIHPKEYTVHQVRALFTSLGFHVQRLDTVHTSPLLFRHRLVTWVMSTAYFLYGVFTDGRPRKPNIGERVIVFAQKGSDIQTELPPEVFES